MRAQDLIRSVLDLLDKHDNHEAELEVDNAAPPEDQTKHTNDANRFKQVFDLMQKERKSDIANSPNVAYADHDAVTINAGGGVNGPKNPADIRTNAPSMYPTYQDGVQ